MFHEKAATPPPTPSHEQPSPPALHTAAAPAPMGSVIGRDLKILGGGLRLISEGELTVDGVVEGDVLATNVIIGQHGHVTGLVHGETVSILGHVSGTIRAADVAMKNGATVDAEIHHTNLSLEFGANFDGRTRRYADPKDLLPDLNGASHDPAE